MRDLDDPSKTCIYIPPGEPEDDDVSVAVQDTEEEDGFDLRMEAYKAAWTKCLDRVRNILQALNAPVANNVVEQVRNAYDDILPGLPYPELPVVALCNINSALVGNITSQLKSYEDEDFMNVAGAPQAQVLLQLQLHLYPAQCSNVMNMMKALVTGFVDRSGGKRKPNSLANYDINLLRAWYAAQESQPRLTVFLHEFEKFEAKVVQDVFYICSMHVQHLPLVFVLIMTSPPTPSYLQSTYPRSTLALLRVHQVSAPTGVATVRDVLTKVFFDPNFEPDIMLGIGALEHISNFATRHTASPDALLTMLQLAHLKHFSHPLSLFVHHELLGAASPHDAARRLTPQTADAVHTRLLAAQSQARLDARPQNARELLDAVSTARVAFRKKMRRMRVAFAFARIAERVALGDASAMNGMGAEARVSRLDSLEALSAVLRGRVSSSVKYVCMAVRILSTAKLRMLLQELHTFLYESESAAVRIDEADARIWIVEALNKLQHADDGADRRQPVPQDAETKDIAGDVGRWLFEYIQERIVRLEDCALWDIWYTGSSPFPSELINPAPRPTIVSALLHPHDFIRAHAELAHASGQRAPFGRGESEDGDDPGELALWELPDTSIAFRRYIDAGRMVNVFDWFESFAVVLDDQRRHLRRRTAESTRGGGVNGNGKGKGKGKRKQTPQTPQTPRTPRRRRTKDDEDANEDGDKNADEDEEGEVDEEEEEKWKSEVQARFIRALHELDYMGFVRHTGRKADHVIRTIYDVAD